MQFDEKICTYEPLKRFYYDVLSEFEKVGTVQQFKVSSSYVRVYTELHTVCTYIIRTY